MMGLWSTLEHAASGVVQGVEHRVEGFVHGVEHAVELNFSDGSLPDGTNPADIYNWFYNGPGTHSYQGTQQSMQELSKSYGTIADHVNAAQRALSSGGWQGSAAQAAQAAIAPMAGKFERLATSAKTTDAALGDQTGSFHTTKSKVIKVPAHPPSGGGLSALSNPAAMVQGVVADAAVAQYQSGTHANQDAYGGYQPPTSSQASALPKAQATSATPPPDQAVTPGRVDPGHTYSGRSSQSYTQGGVNHWTGSGQTHSQAVTPQANVPTHTGVNPPAAHAPGNLPYGGTNAQSYTPPVPGQGGGLPGGQGTDAPPGSPSGGAPGPGGGFAATSGFGPGGPAAGASGTGAGGRSFGGSGSARGVPGASESAPGSGGRAGASGGGRSAAGALSGEESAAAGARGATGRPGAGGIARGMGGARGGKGGEDSEHTTASYLQRNREDELIGEMPLTAPPVIGE
ncbi:MAG: PPE domain-containing protein [Sciscionella sp.]